MKKPATPKRKAPRVEIHIHLDAESFAIRCAIFEDTQRGSLARPHFAAPWPAERAERRARNLRKDRARP